MEEQNPDCKIGKPEDKSPSSTSVRYEDTESIARELPLRQRLARAFREGMASARPDGSTGPEPVKPARTGKDREAAGEARSLSRLMEGGGPAMAGVGNVAAGALDAFVQLVKKTPDFTKKYAEAFRVGAASVREREDKKPQGPSGASTDGQKPALTDGRAILNRVWQAGEAASGFVREAVSVVKPGEVIGSRQKIHLARKKINQLLIDIGSEAASSWSEGLVETEQLAVLLEELRRNEEEIQTLEAQLAEIAAAAKQTAAMSTQRVRQKKATVPSDGQEVSPAVADDQQGELPVLPMGEDQHKAENLPEAAHADDHETVEAPASGLKVEEIPEDLPAEEVAIEATMPEELECEPAIESDIVINSLPANFGQGESASTAEPVLNDEPGLDKQNK